MKIFVGLEKEEEEEKKNPCHIKYIYVTFETRIFQPEIAWKYAVKSVKRTIYPDVEL
jgi:hypothetical protein